MADFKKGDKVKRVKGNDNSFMELGKIYTVYEDTKSSSDNIRLSQDDSYSIVYSKSFFELISSNNIYKNMNILEKFKLSLKGEPQKSYQKAGITDSSDVITDEGQTIFLSYLLSKTPEFKADVVDALLADEKNK